MINKVLNSKFIKKWSFFSVVLFILTQILTLIPPIVMQRVVDEYIPNKDTTMIIVGILLFVLIPLLYIVFQMVFNYFSIKIARNIGNEISIKITENLINQKLSFFDDENSVELVTNSSKEASGYINFYMSELPKYYAYIFISVVIMGILFYYSPYLALIQLLFIPLAILPINKIGRSLEMEIQKVLTNNAKIAQLRTDIFKGIGLVKSLRIEDKKINEVREINSNTASIWGKVTVLDTTTGIWISGFLSKLFTFITFGVGAFLLINQVGNLSIGSLISIVTYIGILYGYMDALFRMQIDRKKQDAEFSRLQQYIDLPGEVLQNKNKKEVKLMDKIEFKNATFKYPKSNNILFENLNLIFNMEQWTGIKGKSGIGKSTLFDLILNNYDLSEGQILFDDEEISNISSFSIRDKITKVSQDIFLFPGTLRENLLLANENASEDDLYEAIRIAHLENYISSLPNGLDTEIGEAGKLMSGGERQRLSLVQGLIRGNKVLLLDEITANLDSKSEHIIKNNLSDLVKTKGYTIISISHNDDFLTEADSVIDLDN